MNHRYVIARIAVLLVIGIPFTLVGQASHQYDFAKLLPAKPVSIAVDPQRNTYVSFANNTVIQYDTRGTVRWQQTFTNLPGIDKLATDRAGSLLIASSTNSGTFTVGDSTYSLQSTDSQTSHIAKRLLIKLDSTHKLQWARPILSGSDGPFYITVDEQNSVYTQGIYARGLEKGTTSYKFTSAGQLIRESYSSLLSNLLVLSPLGIAGTRHGSVVSLRNILSSRDALSPNTYGSGTDVAITKDALNIKADYRNLIGGSPSTPPSYTTNYQETFSTLTVGETDQVTILANYQLANGDIQMASKSAIEKGQLISVFDNTGKAINSKRFLANADSASIGWLCSNPSGTLLLGGQYMGTVLPSTPPFPVRTVYGPNDYFSITGLSSDLSTLWSVQVNSPTGNDALLHLEQDANGAALFTASTSTSLTLGTSTIATSTTAPAYYLAKLSPAALTINSPAQVVCAGSPASLTLTGRFAAYTEGPLTLQLSDAKGEFTSATRIGQISQPQPGKYLSSSVITAAVASTVAAGSGYRLRVISELPYYVGEPIAVTLNQTPARPVVAQQADELVSTARAGNQWYTSSGSAISGATQVRYTPAEAGSYYVVSTQNGCSSASSALISYVITATEQVDSSVKIYPNPTSEQLQVYWKETASSAQIALYDQSGRLVQRVPRSGDLTIINMRGLMTGIYTVSLQIANKLPTARRILLR
ncbi:T9SS type A sorting domain-containing protein [Fibrella forsythiae]|uniref:T9SS type A sorting domain-containing protein n=1 Tax=Fibrella forsythiae TaxID=2817061 RepID=A0ABS3JQG4_9BACT|nr:T9SS type A sorting domain-containing protein [Fibrella forsythiae]MBO0952238.1 T9SS type A sorting domain-containing protein [Fibrella forsythiae]